MVRSCILLERIGNISLEANLKKSRKRRYSNFKGSDSINSHFDINDSISFSPASKYLSRAGWLLKDFKQSDDGKIFIEFIYNDFFFEVNLDLETLNLINSIFYKVSKKKINNFFEKNILATFKISIGGYSSDIPIKKDLRGLEQLFDRFTSLELNRELNRFNYELIDTLLDGVYSILQNDFEYLNYTLLQFLDKQMNKRFGNFVSKFKDQRTEISIQKIKPLDID